MVARQNLSLLLEKVDRMIGASETLQREIGREVEEARKAVARSYYAKLRREPDPHDPEVGSLARALRLRRLLGHLPTA